MNTFIVTVAYYGFPISQPTIVTPPPAPLSLASEMSGPILAFWGDEDTAVGTQNIERFVVGDDDDHRRAVWYR